MKNDCEKYTALLDEYIDNEIKENDSIALKEHINKCAECGKRLQILTVTDKIVNRALEEEDISFDADRIWKNIDAQMDWGPSYWERLKNKIFKPIVWVPALCTAAIVIFVVTILPIQTGTKQMMISSVVEVSSTSGSTMVLKTAQSGTPLIMFFPDTEKEAG